LTFNIPNNKDAKRKQFIDFFHFLLFILLSAL